MQQRPLNLNFNFEERRFIMERKKIKGFIASLLIVFGSTTAFGADADSTLTYTPKVQEYKEDLMPASKLTLWKEVGLQTSAIVGYCGASAAEAIFRLINMPFSAVYDLTDPRAGVEFNSFENNYEKLRDIFTNEDLGCQTAAYKFRAISEVLAERDIVLVDNVDGFQPDNATIGDAYNIFMNEVSQ